MRKYTCYFCAMDSRSPSNWFSFFSSYFLRSLKNVDTWSFCAFLSLCRFSSINSISAFLKLSALAAVCTLFLFLFISSLNLHFAVLNNIRDVKICILTRSLKGGGLCDAQNTWNTRFIGLESKGNGVFGRDVFGSALDFQKTRRSLSPTFQVFGQGL